MHLPGVRRAMRALGEDVSEMLEYVPEHWKVITACAAQVLLRRLPADRAGAARHRDPSRAVMPGPGLLAHVLVSKYCDHLPLYRQSQIYAREGVEIDRSHPGRLGRRRAVLCIDPLVERLGDYVLGAEKLHADDTPVPVLAPGTGKTKHGRLWTYVRDDRPSGSTDPPAVLFRYSPDRKGERPGALWNPSEGSCRPMAMAASTACMIG